MHRYQKDNKTHCLEYIEYLTNDEHLVWHFPNFIFKKSDKNKATKKKLNKIFFIYSPIGFMCFLLSIY